MADTPLTDLQQSTAEEPAARSLDPVEQIDKLLAQAPAPAEQTPPEGADPAEPKPEMALDLKTAAEKLGVPPEDIYKLSVPLKDGHSATLGELKDLWKTGEEIESSRREVAAERGNWMADKMQQEREFREFLSILPKEVFTPELLERARQSIEATASRSREALLRAIPEWADARIENTDKAEILESLKPYGISEREFAQFTDPRSVRLLRDFARLQAKVAAEKVPPKPKVAAAPSRPNTSTAAQQFGQLKAAVKSRRMSPADAVDAFLNQR